MKNSGAVALRKRLVVLIILAAAAWAVSLGMASAATITGSVTRAADGSPIAGATVTASASDQRPVSATSGADGRFSLEVTDAGPLSLGVQADGFAAQSARDVAVGTSVPFVLAPAAFTPLPADVGNFQEIVPDATSGIFYGVGTLGPELYRTVNHGGSWQPVTMSYDDPVHGLRSSNLWKFASASAVPGEIAVAVMGVPNISYSTDYGVTWRTVAGDFGAGTISDSPRPFRLFWAHPAAGSPVNVLIAVERRKDVPGWRVWRADMSAAQPTFAAEATDPFGADSAFGFANTATGAVIGRVERGGPAGLRPVDGTRPHRVRCA